MTFITEWGQIAGFAGLALGVFLFLFREVIKKKIFSKLSSKQSFTFLIIFLILVWTMSGLAIYFYYTEDAGAASQVTVLVHGEKGKDDLVLPNRGQVTLIFGDASVVETINSKGEATFKQVPEKFYNPEATVEILFSDPEGEPYRVFNPDSAYQLTKEKYVALAVKLYGISKIWGLVKDFTTGDFLDSVRVSIHGADTYSNQFGEYTLEIPIEKQQKFQTIRAFKPGYKTFEHKNVPAQTEDEFPIMMKQKIQ